MTIERTADFYNGGIKIEYGVFNGMCFGLEIHWTKGIMDYTQTWKADNLMGATVEFKYRHNGRVRIS